MRNQVTKIFKDRKVNIEKLRNFGFEEIGDIYRYETILKSSGFKVIVEITHMNGISIDVIDTDVGESYTLYLNDGVSGDFVGKVREEVNELLEKIAECCFDIEVFKSEMSKQVIEYIRLKYDDELEFLWKKFSNNAIWRRKDTKKWYGVVLTISKRKLGIDSDEIVEILDFRVKSNELVDYQKFYPAFHMNKKYWCTVILDGSVSFEEICERMDVSYTLAKK